MLSRLIMSFVGWSVSVFYDVARSGPALPAGPVLIAANHPNALVDPLVIFYTGGRPSRPLAKAPLFEQAVVGTVLKGLGGLPVYRREDNPDQMHRNEQTFDAAIEALHGGGAVQIYPEGQSHSKPALSPLRTGAARIALLAEARSGWSLGLRVQPVGLTYTRKHMFRGGAVAAYGPPIEVAEYRGLFESDEREAVRALTDAIRVRLEQLTLNFEEDEHRELVDVAERVYARAKRLAAPRERQPMIDRLPRLRRMAEGLRWLRATDSERYERVLDDVRRYLRLLTLFGAREGDVPARFRTGRVLRYSARQLVMLTLVLPVAAVGMVAWGPAYLFTRFVAPRFRPRLDQLATYKLGTALLAFPVWYAALLVAVLLRFGPWGFVVAAVGFPLTGLAAVAWRDRQAEVLEDARVYLRARRPSESRDRLAEQRALLVAELDALREAWEADVAGPEIVTDV